MEKKELQLCTLCPRNCKANRKEGGKGYCQVSSELLVARAALHMWEEPCISGAEGSGAVFFSGCSLGCIYCQNYEISRAQAGKKISQERLTEIILELQEQGANTINLVTAGHYLMEVIPALQKAKQQGLHLPVVYNSSGYEKTEAIRMLEGLVDVYLPDLKYLDSSLAARLSGAADYPQVAQAALQEMVRQQPLPVFNERGIMKKGVIVRHLLLPGHVKEAKNVLTYLLETYGSQIYVSIMNQYTPVPAVAGDPLLSRKVTRREYERVLDHACNLGLEQGFIQDGETASESFIPPFDQTGV